MTGVKMNRYSACSAILIARLKSCLQIRRLGLAALLVSLLAANPSYMVSQEKSRSRRSTKDAGKSMPVNAEEAKERPVQSEATQANASAASDPGGQQRTPQKFIHEGLSIEFSVDPIEKGGAELLEGEEATVRFKITESRTGKAITNLHPAAWIERSSTGQAPDNKECREKIQSFLQASFGKRADIDLNTYFVLALNQEPNISVIAPLSGFGSSKLYTLVSLTSPGEDWLMSADQKRLFVSMPLAGQVAVVDTATWKAVANVNAGPRPTRIALQHDEKYLWVENDVAGETERGVTVIDATTLKVVAHLNTGAGHHEIAFTDDDRYAFVTNKQDGTLSVIDVRKLARIKEIKVGALPTALAFSPLSKAVYVANEGDGMIVVVDGQRQEISTRIKATPGLSAMRFSPDGRFGFVVNRQASVVHIFDASNNELLHTVPVESAPDQLTLTKNFAYVRALGNEFVSMISLANIGKGNVQTAVTRFPGGQKAPQLSPFTSPADAIVPAPEEGSVLVANPADQMIYYYMEGMAAPMGSFQNYRRDPRALLVVDRSLRETSPGLYATTIKLTGFGRFDVAFLLDTPRVVNCFELSVRENPDLQKRREVPIKIEPLVASGAMRVGETYRLQFKVTNTQDGQPKSNLEDLGVLTFLSPGIWQQRNWAKPLGNGLYEINFVPPQAGIYYIMFHCPSLGVDYKQIPFLMLQATAQSKTATPNTASPGNATGGPPKR
jgi:YVTN family beta-propeller protein